MSELMHSVLIIVVFDPVVGWNDLAMSYSLNVKSVTDHFNVLGLNFTADIMDCFDSYIWNKIAHCLCSSSVAVSDHPTQNVAQI